MCLDLKYCKKKKGRNISSKKPITGYKEMILNPDGTLSSVIHNPDDKRNYLLNVEYEAYPKGKIKIKRLEPKEALFYEFIEEGAFHYRKKNRGWKIVFEHASNDLNNVPSIKIGKCCYRIEKDHVLVRCEFWGETYEEKFQMYASIPESCSKYMKIVEIVKR